MVGFTTHKKYQLGAQLNGFVCIFAEHRNQNCCKDDKNQRCCGYTNRAV